MLQYDRTAFPDAREPAVMKNSVRIASRRSHLALWQARHVASMIRRHYPEWHTEVVAMTTSGDTMLDKPLSEDGGKGLFVKELEQALLNLRVDIAVHSMKDVPAILPDGLIIAAIMRREDPADVLVSNRFADMDQLPDGAVIGTSSMRRCCQLAHYYPGLVTRPLRGNVNTRLERLNSGQFDAIVLACAGLKRLGHTQLIRKRIPFAICLPAIGQGALGIECRSEDVILRRHLEVLHDNTTGNCVTAERTVGKALGGDCRLPIAAYAERRYRHLFLRARVGSPDGVHLLAAQAENKDPHIAADEVTRSLIAQGADQILHHPRAVTGYTG